jgi:hypothetical protein
LQQHSSSICHQDVATDGVREATQSHASESPSPGEDTGEVGCLFDEIGNLVEPTERPDMDVPAGPQRGMDAEASRPERPGHRRTAMPMMSRT